MDLHLTPPDWGIAPILFTLAGISVPAYSFFVGLGLIVGILVYTYDAYKCPITDRQPSGWIPLCALFFGAIGAKIPMWIVYHDLWFQPNGPVLLLLTGKTIVGGLIGGMLGVWLAKKITKTQVKRGNRFAPAIALGMALGRLGCFFQGCCYGAVTNLPWGTNFGDHLFRHPTQLYEVIFHSVAFVWLRLKKSHQHPGGLYLRQYFMAYFAYRFLSEFIRTEPRWLLGLTAYQWASVICLSYLGFTYHRATRQPISLQQPAAAEPPVTQTLTANGGATHE